MPYDRGPNHDHHAGHGAGEGHTVDLDITPVLAALRERALWTEGDIEVTFVPRQAGVEPGERIEKATPIEFSRVGHPHLFTGQRQDPATGLYYYKARYYSPGLGRFLTTDPLEYVDGWNLYEYVGSTPTTSRDPVGLIQDNGGSDSPLQSPPPSKPDPRDNEPDWGGFPGPTKGNCYRYAMCRPAGPGENPFANPGGLFGTTADVAG